MVYSCTVSSTRLFLPLALLAISLPPTQQLVYIPSIIVACSTYCIFPQHIILYAHCCSCLAPWHSSTLPTHGSHCTLYVAWLALHIAHAWLALNSSTLHFAHTWLALHIAHCIAHCTLHIAHGTLHCTRMARIAHCTLHMAHCIAHARLALHIAHAWLALHIAHCTRMALIARGTSHTPWLTLTHNTQKIIIIIIIIINLIPWQACSHHLADLRGHIAQPTLSHCSAYTTFTKVTDNRMATPCPPLLVLHPVALLIYVITCLFSL